MAGSLLNQEDSKMIRWKKAAAAAAIAVTTALAVTACAGGGTDGAVRRRREEPSRSARSSRRPPYDPAGAEWGNRCAVLPGGLRHASARHARGHDRAVARDRVVVQRGQHGAHPHPARRRHLHRRHQSSPAMSSSSNLQRFKDGTSPEAGYFAGVTLASRRPMTRRSSSPSMLPTPRCSTT